MKKITITVSVDGNEISRNYGGVTNNWEAVVVDMLDTIEKSNDPKF